jgi:uncharacterized RDD family membrane protein YckC
VPLILAAPLTVFVWTFDAHETVYDRIAETIVVRAGSARP